MDIQVTHRDYMQLALQLAERGRLSVSPNPMVGCVIVKNNQIIGQGFHQNAGEDHAEVLALKAAENQASGATMYLTLEPCCHFGRTPPCVDALIDANIKKIYIACLDPNPLIAGRGLNYLRQHGIEVELGLLKEEAFELNHIFFHYIKYKRPFVIAKWAMSLDGKTITHSGDSRQISSTNSQNDAHRIRKKVDAVLIGAHTARIDDPLLTVRYQPMDPRDKQPLRIILSATADLPLNLKLFDTTVAKTLIATTTPINLQQQDFFYQHNVECLVLPKTAMGHMDLNALLSELGKREITSLLIEGGMTTHEYFIKENLINQFHVYVAPVIIGSQSSKKILRHVQLKNIDHDFHFSAYYPTGELYV